MAKTRQWIPNFDSTLGLKQSHAITNMPFGALLDVKNMNLNGLGGKDTRNGMLPLFHLTNGAGGARITDEVRSLFQYRKSDGTVHYIAYGGTRLFRKNGTGTDSVILRSSLTDDTLWSFVQYNDLVHGVNGSNTSFLWDGTTAITISITAPSAHVTLSAVAGGTLTNNATYDYLVTFYDNTNARESEPFTVSSAQTQAIAAAPGANRTIRLSALPSATAGEGITGAQYRIYRRRSVNGGVSDEQQFARLTAIDYDTYNPDTGTGQWDDDGTNGATGGTNYLEYDDGTYDTGYTAHPQSKVIAEAFDRIYMVDETDFTKLVYSQAGKSFAFPSANYFQVGRTDGNRIMRLERFGESLLIHKRNGTWILTSDSVSPIRLSPVGVQDIRSSVVAENLLIKLTPNGYYKSDPTTFSVADLREDYIGGDIDDEEGDIDWGATDDMNLIFYRGNKSKQVLALYPVSSSYKTDVHVYDVGLGEWVLYEIATDIFSVAEYEDDGQRLLMMGDGYGQVFTWDTGTTDGISLDSDELNGTATSASSTTLTDTGQSWTTGDEVQPAGDSDLDWNCVASDSDGSNLIAGVTGGRLYTSSDYGENWTERQPGGDVDLNWYCVDSDSDGTNLIAGVAGGRLYTSADSGATWTERQPAGAVDKTWWSVSSDSDGSLLVAAVFNGRLYTSADSGATWTERQPAGAANKFWRNTDCDSDGSNIIVAVLNGRLYTSADSGVSWTERQPAGDANKNWRAVASDSDGSNLVVAISTGRVYISTDSGATWSETQPNGDVNGGWVSVSSDDDGSHIVIADGGPLTGTLYMTTDSGANWSENQISGSSDNSFINVDINSDGSRVIAGETDGRLYVSANEMTGMVVNIRSGTGSGQRRRIVSNTSNTVVVNTAWTVNPDSTSLYSIAAIDAYGEEFWDSNGDPHLWKRMRWIVPYLEQTGDYEVELKFRRDFKSVFDSTQDIDLSASDSSWGDDWGVLVWGAQTSNLNRVRLSGKYHFYSIRYRNELAGQPFSWNGHGAVFQVLGDRNK